MTSVVGRLWRDRDDDDADDDDDDDNDDNVVSSIWAGGPPPCAVKEVSVGKASTALRPKAEIRQLPVTSMA